MSQKAADPGSLPGSQDSTISQGNAQPDIRMPMTVPIAIGIAGMFLFVVSQMVVVAGAAVWAVGEYFHFHLIGFALLIALASLPVGFGSWKVLLLAIAAERDPANN